MTEELKEHYESKLREIINDQVEISIKKTVNGKIDALTKVLNDYIIMDTEWKNNSEAWRKTAQPTINFATESAGFIQIGKYLVLGITAIGAFIFTLIKLIQIFK